jgi:hypothetical protein
MLIALIPLLASNEPRFLGLDSETVTRLSNSELDAYLSTYLGFDDPDPILDNLTVTLDDSDVSVLPIPPCSISTRDPNAKFERDLLSRLPPPTPAPAITPARRPTASTRGAPAPGGLRVIHAKPTRRPDPDPESESEYPDHDDDYSDDVPHDYDPDSYYDRYPGYYGGEDDYAEEEPFDLELDEPFDDKLVPIEKWARPHYTIVGISPATCPTMGTCRVALEIVPRTEGHCFCRFDSVIVEGLVNGSGIAFCETDRHDTSVASVYFSKDRKNWFGPIQLAFVPVTGFHSLIVFAPAGMFLMLICGLGMWALSIWADGRAKANMRREMAIMARARR